MKPKEFKEKLEELLHAYNNSNGCVIKDIRIRAYENERNVPYDVSFEVKV